MSPTPMTASLPIFSLAGMFERSRTAKDAKSARKDSFYFFFAAILTPDPSPPVERGGSSAPAEGGAGSKRIVLGCDPGAGCSAEIARVLTYASTVTSPETGAPVPRFGAPSPLGRRGRDEGRRLRVEALARFVEADRR